MTALARSGHIDVGGMSLEYRRIGAEPAAGSAIVMLHEGLGCVGLWSTFPERLAEATGMSVLAYSRAGYGSSSPVTLPRPLTYMHDEARVVLPTLLDAIGFREGILLGHSDGASIAAIYAGSHADHRIRGLVLLAPHVICEDVSVASIAATKTAYETTDLKDKLARWHNDVDVAFWGWNGAWLDPRFRDWDITEFLPYIQVPVQVIQGEADQYGTKAQVEIIAEDCQCPVDIVMLPGVGHSPHREAADATLAAVGRFVAELHRFGELNTEAS